MKMFGRNTWYHIIVSKNVRTRNYTQNINVQSPQFSIVLAWNNPKCVEMPLKSVDQWILLLNLINFINGCLKPQWIPEWKLEIYFGTGNKFKGIDSFSNILIRYEIIYVLFFAIVVKNRFFLYFIYWSYLSIVCSSCYEMLQTKKKCVITQFFFNI